MTYSWGSHGPCRHSCLFTPANFGVGCWFFLRHPNFPYRHSCGSERFRGLVQGLSCTDSSSCRQRSIRRIAFIGVHRINRHGADRFFFFVESESDPCRFFFCDWIKADPFLSPRQSVAKDSYRLPSLRAVLELSRVLLLLLA